MDNRAAVKVGGLNQNVVSIQVVNPKFTTDSPQEHLFVKELILRAHEVGGRRTFIDISKTGKEEVGDHLKSMRTGMPYARLSTRESKDQSGRPCTATFRTCIMP